MAISPYLRGLRDRVGHALVLMPSAGALVRDDEGRTLLLVNRDTGAYMLPGGALDPGESPAEAVVRETAEETGLAVRPTHLAAVVGPWRVHYPNDDRVEYMASIFLCQVTGGWLHARDGEAAGFYWCPSEELPDLGYPPALVRWRPGDPALYERPSRAREGRE